MASGATASSSSGCLALDIAEVTGETRRRRDGSAADPLAATLYSPIRHAGAPGYLAAMALISMAPDSMRFTALALNVLVAIIGSMSYVRAGHFDWRTFYLLAILSIPAAFIGGAIHLSPAIYKPAVTDCCLSAAIPRQW